MCTNKKVHRHYTLIIIMYLYSLTICSDCFIREYNNQLPSDITINYHSFQGVAKFMLLSASHFIYRKQRKFGMTKVR